MVHFTGLLENARHPVGGLLWLDPWAGPLVLDFCKNRVWAGIGGWPGTATGGQIHVVHISHTHPPKEIIQALRKYLLGKKYALEGSRRDLQNALLCTVLVGSVWVLVGSVSKLNFSLFFPFFERHNGPA